MPLYEYHCEECGEPFALRRSIDERDSGVTCPNCSTGRVVRLMSSFTAFSRGESGNVQSVSTGACSNCSSTTGCAGCGSAHA
ncbi:MAG: FmdB family zinc ribbon protein [Rudaea sp.]